MSASVKPIRGKAFGIINPYGDLWTHQTVRDERAARDHIEAFWRGTTTMDTSRFKIVPVRVTVSLDRSKGASQ